jgi:hypothetical protein
MADRDDATAAAIVTAYLNDPTRRVEHEIAEAIRAARAEGEAAGRAAAIEAAARLIEQCNSGAFRVDIQGRIANRVRALAPSPGGNRGG